MVEEQDSIRDAARKRIKGRREFWNLALIFVIVTIILNAVWLLSGYREYYWPAWPMIGFGIALFFTGLSAFGPGSRPITEEAIDREIGKLNKN